MSPDTHQHGRTRRAVARVAVTSALALMPIAAIAVPALADAVVLEPADQIDLVHDRPGHNRHGHDNWNRGRNDDWNRGRNDHGNWNRGRNDNWNRGRDDDWNRGRHDHGNWNRGGNGWNGLFPLPFSGSAF
ncbi:hypothetical protein OHB12_15910 [Nocardia sp. NBC_01730]|uniref:hypothetical protein n=1 Tax=Nocardia sp. NBC_01730 TaxID=2975998 RepID=UPI002E14E555|nr:hypothetical protein OHB12_15910 [Nocardia sp. NBC_01730]